MNNQENVIEDQSPTNENTFLESSIISDIIRNIESLEETIKDKQADQAIDIRIKQLAYAKLLVNVYEKDLSYLINALTNLGITYLENKYFEQAQEHLLGAFKLNESLGENENEEQGRKMKELQIIILINLAKTYLELKKIAPSLNISERCLKMNQALNGEDHVSNTEIYNILARGNAILENFKAAEGYFSKIFDLYEKTYGFDSDKCAQTCIDLAQIYELNNNLNDAAEYYKFSFEIWEKVIKVNPTEEGYDKMTLAAEKHSMLLMKCKEVKEAYNFLKNFEKKQNEEGFKCSNKEIKLLNSKKLLLKFAESLGSNEIFYEELKSYEVSKAK